MANLWLRIKVWFKVIIVALFVLYLIIFTYKNASEKARFWYWFGHQPETTLLLLVLCSFLVGILASFLIGTTFRTVRQIQEIKERSRAKQIDRQIADIHSKAAMLQTKPMTPEPIQPPTEEKP